METILEYLLDSRNTLRFRNNGIKHFRKMSICVLKFFRFVSALKLVHFSDLLVFGYAFLIFNYLVF